MPSMGAMPSTRSFLWLFVLLALIYQCDCEDETTDEIVIDSERVSIEEEPFYTPPKAVGQVFWTEAFETMDSVEKRWVKSKAKKEGAEAELTKYDGEWKLEPALEHSLRGDMGLVLKSKAKHAAIATKLAKPFVFKGAPFVVQYEVKFQNPMECGGAYIKLLMEAKDLKLEQFHDKSPYTIMFGPDKCGAESKLHFIFQHKNPNTGKLEEKHGKKPAKDLTGYFNDKKTHLYTLIVLPDNRFEIYIDKVKIDSGNLLEDMDPPVDPPETIDDPNDKKPDDWDDREKIKAPDAKKPDDWDEDEPAQIVDTDATKPDDWLDEEEEYIDDPEATRPEDWDDDMDGEWEPPKIKNPKCESASGCGEWNAPMKANPKYKGKWHAPLVDNPNYKGVWKPRTIRNPDWFHDPEPYKMSTIAAVGLELWSMTDNVMFDNFIITDSKETADNWASLSWDLKYNKEVNAIDGEGFLQNVFNYTQERPWLWAVYIVAIVLPIVLIVTYCCSSSAKDSAPKHSKKTDAITPDDPILEEEEEEDEQGLEEEEEEEE